MLGLEQAHHIATIATDYTTGKAFYCDALDFALIGEAYREERNSWKGDPASNGQYVIELFSFLLPLYRPSRPEAYGLRHLVLSMEDVEKSTAHLETHHVKCESIRTGPFTDKHFILFDNPDGLPLELYEI